MNVDDATANLMASRLLRSPDEVDKFEAALAALAVNATASDLPAILRVFDDQTKHDEVMFGLIHLVETFDPAAQIRAMATTMPDLIRQSLRWVDTMNYRLLNDDASRSAYRAVLKSLDRVSADWLREPLFRIANTEAPPLSARAQEVLA